MAWGRKEWVIGRGQEPLGRRQPKEKEQVRIDDGKSGKGGKQQTYGNYAVAQPPSKCRGICLLTRDNNGDAVPSLRYRSYNMVSSCAE